MESKVIRLFISMIIVSACVYAERLVSAETAAPSASSTPVPMSSSDAQSLLDEYTGKVLTLTKEASSALLGNGTSGAAPVPAGFTRVVPAPCLKENDLQSPRLDLQSCSYLFPRPGQSSSVTITASSASPRPSPSPNVTFMQNFHNFFSDRIKWYYKGCLAYRIRSSQDAVGTSNRALASDETNIPNGICAGVQIFDPNDSQKVVCNMADGEGSDDTTHKTNHNGKDCGSPASDSTVEKWIKGQYRGLWVQSVKYYRDQIENQEIIGSRSLKISPQCDDLAKDYLRVSDDAKKVSQQLTGTTVTSLPSQVYSGGVNFCSDENITDQLALSSSQVTPEVWASLQSIPRSAACYLSTARDSQVLLFVHLARCELWARINTLSNSLAVDKTAKLNDITLQCYNRAIDSAHKYHDDHPTATRGDVVSHGRNAFWRCYPVGLRQFFQDIDRDLLPGVFRE